MGVAGALWESRVLQKQGPMLWMSGLGFLGIRLAACLQRFRIRIDSGKGFGLASLGELRVQNHDPYRASHISIDSAGVFSL